MVTDPLVSLASAGDDEAFRALVEPHRRELRLHCYRMLGSKVAGMLDTTEDAVTSALKRARAGLPDRDHDRTPLPGSAMERAVAGAFADAVESGDIDAMVSLLTDDAWLTMPPAPMQYQGIARIAEFMRGVGFRNGVRRYRLVPTTANGQPAYGCYISESDDPVAHAHGLLVLTLAGDRVSAVTRFIDNSVLPYFALPEQCRWCRKG